MNHIKSMVQVFVRKLLIHTANGGIVWTPRQPFKQKPVFKLQLVFKLEFKRNHNQAPSLLSSLNRTAGLRL